MRLASSLTLSVALGLASCAPKPPAQLNVTDAVVRLAATREAPSVAYFTIHGGPADDRLLDVISPVVIKTEMHESMMSGGPGSMVSMKPIEGGIPVPANSVVAFKEGGRHLMLSYVNPGIKPGKTVPFIFTFTSGTRLDVDAKVVAAGTTGTM